MEKQSNRPNMWCFRCPLHYSTKLVKETQGLITGTVQGSDSITLVYQSQPCFSPLLLEMIKHPMWDP